MSRSQSGKESAREFARAAQTWAQEGIRKMGQTVGKKVDEISAQAALATAALAQTAKSASAEVGDRIQDLDRQVRAYLASREFEATLDELLKTAGADQSFAAFYASERSANDGVQDEGSSPSEASSKVEAGADAVTDRIRLKLRFLLKHHRNEILKIMKKTAFYGSTFGPMVAVRVATVAGGVKLLIVFAGVVYTILIKKNGEWTVTEAPQASAS